MELVAFLFWVSAAACRLPALKVDDVSRGLASPRRACSSRSTLSVLGCRWLGLARMECLGSASSQYSVGWPICKKHHHCGFYMTTEAPSGISAPQLYPPPRDRNRQGALKSLRMHLSSISPWHCICGTVPPSRSALGLRLAGALPACLFLLDAGCCSCCQARPRRASKRSA